MERMVNLWSEIEERVGTGCCNLVDVIKQMMR